MSKHLLLILICLNAIYAFGQNTPVRGKVIADDGTSLVGVNVVEKGTTNGTVTDSDGNYSIETAPNATLVFSFIGMVTKEVPIQNKSVVDAMLDSDVQQLQEIVVTGYGVQQDKRSLTGSVVSVKGEAFENLPVQSADRAIQGRLSGVQVASASGQPGGALNIRVRGIGSVNAGNDPLWIVDGVQMTKSSTTGQPSATNTQTSSNPLASINPNDIESIDVLKDAAAAAIYGAQAANGVVIVTTKRGKKGPVQVNFSTQQGVNDVIGQYKMMNGLQFATIRAEAYRNAGLDPAAPNNAHELYGDPNQPANIKNFDWVDAMFKRGRLSTYDLSFSQADEKISFLFSTSYQRQQGMLINSDWKRGTTRMNLSFHPNKKLTINTNVSLAYEWIFGPSQNGNFVNAPFSAVYIMQPTSVGIDPETGRYNLYPERGAHNFGFNILQNATNEVRTGKTAHSVSSLNASYELLPGLTINGLAGINFITVRDDNQRPATIPYFANDGGQVSVSFRRAINWNSNATLNYSKKIGDNHTISALVGYEYKVEQREGVNASKFGFSNPFFRLLSQGSTNRPSTESYNDFKRQGFFGQVKYALKDRYLADFTLRKDGSSRFGVNHRYGTFYAGSVAWRMKSESFLESATFLDDLKVRVAYGLVGNSDIGDYDALSQWGTLQANASTAGITQGSYVGQSVLRPIRLGNDLLTWEDEEQVSGGVDFILFANRIYGSVEYYSNTTKSLLFDTPLPADAGFSNVKGNVAKIVNRGIEIEIGGVILDIEAFKWRTSFNFSTLHNEVTELPSGKSQLGGPGVSGNFLIKGQPLAFMYLAQYAGVNPATGKAMVYDTLGNLAYQATVRDLAVRGTPIPKYFGGWSNNFSYKGLSLELFLQYQGGNQVVNQDLYSLANSGSDADNQLVTQLQRWQNPGDITNVPRPYQGSGGVIDGFDQTFGTYGSTRFMSDASYVRLKQVTVSYNLPRAWLTKIGVTRASIFAQALNLYTWTKYDGIDPEVIANNNTLANTPSVGAFPNSRQYSIGLTLGL